MRWRPCASSSVSRPRPQPRAAASRTRTTPCQVSTPCAAGRFVPLLCHITAGQAPGGLLSLAHILRIPQTAAASGPGLNFEGCQVAPGAPQANTHPRKPNSPKPAAFGIIYLGPLAGSVGPSPQEASALVAAQQPHACKGPGPVAALLRLLRSARRVRALTVRLRQDCLHVTAFMLVRLLRELGVATSHRLTELRITGEPLR